MCMKRKLSHKKRCAFTAPDARRHTVHTSLHTSHHTCIFKQRERESQTGRQTETDRQRRLYTNTFAVHTREVHGK